MPAYYNFVYVLSDNIILIKIIAEIWKHDDTTATKVPTNTSSQTIRQVENMPTVDPCYLNYSN